MAEDLSANPNMGFQAIDGVLLANTKMGFKNTDAGAPISVWWDYENCEVMQSADAGSIANNIIVGLTKLGLSGPLTLAAYGDVGRIPPKVSMCHLTCVYGQLNTHPATYMLISGDKDFSTCLHRLRNLGYDILLAAFQTNCSSHLVSAAHHFLPWTDICLRQMSEVNKGAAMTSTVNYSSPSTHSHKAWCIWEKSETWIARSYKEMDNEEYKR